MEVRFNNVINQIELSDALPCRAKVKMYVSKYGMRIKVQPYEDDGTLGVCCPSCGEDVTLEEGVSFYVTLVRDSIKPVVKMFQRALKEQEARYGKAKG